MAISCSCVIDLLNEIVKLRKNEITIDPESFTVVTPSDPRTWSMLFSVYFLNGTCCGTRCSTSSLALADDMLWYVRHPKIQLGHRQHTSLIEVFRRHSKKQPSLIDNSIDWQETVYLNLILQQVEYTLTCAVCTKTSPQNLQILRKNSQRVFASPSRRKMDSKGEGEEITFPNIYFSIDAFEEVFGDIVVRDGECVCVELVARDRRSHNVSAVFLGSIRYEVLKQVYDTRATGTWQWAQRVLGSNRRVEYVRMRGPHGKGYAEMAVSRVQGMGFETPTTEQLNFQDFEIEAAEQYRRRRLSDNNLTSSKYYSTARSPVKKSQSEADCANRYPEVEANSLDDELEESVFTKLWSMRGFGQTWHWLREKRRAESTPLNSFLTYITVPIHSIVQDMLDSPRRPVLTFDFQ